MSTRLPDHSFEPLSPIAFLHRATAIYAERVAVIDGDERLTYAELGQNTRHFAGALVAAGVAAGDRVAVLAPNSRMMLEAHYAVPGIGAALVPLNLRLSAGELAYIIEHSGARVLVCHDSLADLAAEAVAAVSGDVRVLDAHDLERPAEGAPLVAPADERAVIALNYTSGTTGRPKGVMYHHRGAYLQSLAMALHTRLGPGDTYLWTLPMFHCDGWSFTWAVTAVGATHLCLPKVDAGRIWELLHEDGVTHFSAAPTVLSSLADHPSAARLERPAPIRVATGGAPPSPSLLAKMEELNIEITHLYGLTETFGPSVICEWNEAWDELDADVRAQRRARQGVPNVLAQGLRVLTPDEEDVPADGQTMGEVVLRGNNVMLGYYRDDEATAKATRGGWFHTGDLGVMHPDGYIELRDRLKDIIISGAENIASIEVEAAVSSHPAVLEVAVIAVPSEHWGERPAAFVTLRAGEVATADEIRAHVRSTLPGFKVPDTVEFGPLPKTGTGKIQKNVLRDQAWGQHGDRRIA